jgi:hypothetical protein
MAGALSGMVTTEALSGALLVLMELGRESRPL